MFLLTHKPRNKNSLLQDIGAIVFSFAVGSYAPFTEFEKISLRSGGVARIRSYGDSDVGDIVK